MVRDHNSLGLVEQQTYCKKVVPSEDRRCTKMQISQDPPSPVHYVRIGQGLVRMSCIRYGSALRSDVDALPTGQ